MADVRPYGYVVVDGRPHPNPRKAAEGYRLLALDDIATGVVPPLSASTSAGRARGVTVLPLYSRCPMCRDNRIAGRVISMFP